MIGTVLLLILAALCVGALIGWLVGSRAAAAAKQTVDNLRLQLDAVVKERDVNRDAATRLAALEAGSARHRAVVRVARPPRHLAAGNSPRLRACS